VLLQRAATTQKIQACTNAEQIRRMVNETYSMFAIENVTDEEFAGLWALLQQTPVDSGSDVTHRVEAWPHSSESPVSPRQKGG
jgi:hypothetical protein